MKADREHIMRSERVAEWYTPARFGLFYHWGMYTGGGDSGAHEWASPLYYDTIEDMEVDAGDPVNVARNMVDAAVRVGAKYIIYTVFHTCDRFAIMYPTAIDAFVNKTSRDYVGALVDEAHRRNIKTFLYLPPANPVKHIFSEGGPWLKEGYRDCVGFAKLLKEVVKELYTQHGDKIAGFWLDGMMPEDMDLPHYIHQFSPHLIVTINNEVLHNVHETDMGTTEFLSGTPDPAYNRNSGLIHAHPRFGHILPPKRDYNEDIPTCNGWWHRLSASSQEEIRTSEYVKDPTFWVKQMVSSLGQRGIWNYVLGIGPLIDGTMPPIFEPMMQNMTRFLEWAGESIYNTRGGENSGFPPGWWNEGSFGSVTVSLADPRIHYLHLTTPPSGKRLRVPHNGVEILEVTDLRSGKQLPFQSLGCLDLDDLDYGDIEQFGDKIFKVICA